MTKPIEALKLRAFARRAGLSREELQRCLDSKPVSDEIAAKVLQALADSRRGLGPRDAAWLARYRQEHGE